MSSPHATPDLLQPERDNAPWRTGTVVLLLLLLLGFAYEPFARAGFVGEDYRLLWGAHGRGGPDSGEEPKPLWRMHGHEFFDVQGVGGSMVPGFSISASLRLWGTEDGELPAALGYRVENLAWLIAASLLLARFVRRLLLPWTGSEHARAAAWASALLLVFHPLSYAAVGSVGGRAPILYLGLVAGCAAAFLRARQDRDPMALLVATIAALAASLTSEAALGLPVLLASAEFAAAHRYRPLRARARTAISTFALCATAVQIGPLVRSSYLNEPTLPILRRILGDLAAPSGFWQALVGGAEKLGALCLPVNVHSGGAVGIAAAGLLLLLALQPAMRAARTAPRLWAWLLVGWVAALVIAGLPSATRRVHLGDLTEARALLPVCAVMAVGLAVAATARTGLWRFALPAVLVVGQAALGRSNAAPWEDAAAAVAELRQDVRRARELEGIEHRIVVLDPPLAVRGVAALGRSIGWALGQPPTISDELPEVLGLTSNAFLAFAREREFDELSARSSLIFPYGSAARDSVEGAPSYVRFEAGDAGQVPHAWSGDARSPDLDWNPARVVALLATAPAGANTSEPPEVSWRAREASRRFGKGSGSWFPGAERPTAWFDLSASIDWMLGGRIRRVWFEELPTVQRVEPVERMPVLGPGVEPDPQGADWFFPTPHIPLPAGVVEPDGEWRVALLDLGSFVYHELGVVAGPSGTLRVLGAADLVADRVRASGGPVAWSLDFRVGNATLARASGRRIGVSGSREETIVPPRH